MMIKQISQFYSEKVNQAKDSVNIRNATMLEFVYEYLQNRYGKTPILGRKVKEILLTVMKNETKFKNIKLFGKFLGICLSTAYTNDDLSMYYTLNRLFYINDVYMEANSVKREFNFDKGKMNVGKVFDHIKLYYSGKTSHKNMNKLLSEILSKVGTDKNKRAHILTQTTDEALYSMTVDCEDVYFCCIKSYQTSKVSIVNYFLDNNLIQADFDEDESVISDKNSVIMERSELMEESFDEENKEEFLQPSPKKERAKKEVDIKGLMLDQVYR